MSNIERTIPERAANIGNFMVGRLLPFRQKRSVGPFVFIDHMGPEEMSEQQNLDVLPHPHIGLSTLTFLFDGAMVHRDSLGNEVEIRPGAVNWMTAGKGVVHSERTPTRLRNKKKRLHGLQIWVALPKDLQECEPSFIHIPANEIPARKENGLEIKLIAGELNDLKSPVPVKSPLYLMELTSATKQKVDIGDRLYGESALYILKGTVTSEGNEYDAKQILVAKDAELCSFEMSKGAVIYIFGGDPFPEERFIDWNFVSSSKERLKKAKEDWIQKRFPVIKGENGFVPYPGTR